MALQGILLKKVLRIVEKGEKFVGGIYFSLGGDLKKMKNDKNCQKWQELLSENVSKKVAQNILLVSMGDRADCANMGA